MSWRALLYYSINTLYTPHTSTKFVFYEVWPIMIFRPDFPMKKLIIIFLDPFRFSNLNLNLITFFPKPKKAGLASRKYSTKNIAFSCFQTFHNYHLNATQDLALSQLHPINSIQLTFFFCTLIYFFPDFKALQASQTLTYR